MTAAATTVTIPQDEAFAASPAHDKITEWLIFGQIIGVTFLQKFAITIGGTQIFLGLAVIVALTMFGFLTGRLEVRKDNLALYLLLAGTMAMTQLLGGLQFSITSMLLLFVIHAPYAFGMGGAAKIRPNIHLLFFQKVMVVIAVLGFVQFFAQYVVGPDLAFPVDRLLPESLIMQGFHGMNPMGYRSDIFKSNGVFLKEPSNFCQLLAISIVIEMIYFKNWKRLLIYGLGVAVTFSGTGLVILFVLVPVYLIQNRRFITLLALFIMVVSAPLWAPVVGLEKTVARAGEFDNPHSSGYARFFSIFPTLNTYILSENDTLFFGQGAGAAVRVFQDNYSIDYATHIPSWGKVIFEYGMLGGLIYYVFLGYIFWRARVSGYIKAALLIQFMLLGEYVLAPTVHGLILALVAWPPREIEWTLDPDTIDEPKPQVLA